MAISFDQSIAVHVRALAVTERRAELLASNLANADTPGYKARDIDFRAALEAAGGQQGLALERSDPGHLPAASGGHGSMSVEYRVPTQPSLDGNTVDTHLEQARFAENALRYEAALTFIGGRIRGLRQAIKGQ